MTRNLPYLQDRVFLKQFDKQKLKEQYVRLTVLTFDEEPIQNIDGRVTGGNISLDGSSGMRRTCNLNMVVDDYEHDFINTKALLSINKKVEVFIGFTNTTNQYTNYPILWFPQGVYVIISPNISHSNDGVSVSLTLHDKIALLNGECGGILPAAVTFNEREQADADGNVLITQPTIYQIIQELVNHFGGQQLGKIIIGDIDNKIKKVMKWTGSTPLYLYTETKNNEQYNHFTTNRDEIKDREGTIKEFSYGQDIGYILADFVYPGSLIGNAGDSVTTILDQIKNTLGNYEYFYDIDGNFRFQEIKNYLNTSYSTVLVNELNSNHYLVDYCNRKSEYIFENTDIIQSTSNSFQYQQIKNDFVVWGKRTTMEGKDVPIRYHLAIDNKPTIARNKVYSVFFFTDPEDGITKAKKPLEYPYRDGFPKKGDFNQFYFAKYGPDAGIYKWTSNGYQKTEYKIEQIKATDWRTELYLSGVDKEPLGLDSNYYYTELKNEWPKLYDVKNQKFFNNEITKSSDIDFFLDFIDTTAAVSEFNVQNIGRRTLTIVDDTINCIFESQTPNIVILEKGSDNIDVLQEECRSRQQEYVLVDTAIYSLLLGGGTQKSAYEEIKKELYQYTNYGAQISLTTLPIYYLEPNTRITVSDPDAGIYGDYIIKSFSLPLDINSTMNISCTRALERI